jgi:hypothetical protein
MGGRRQHSSNGTTALSLIVRTVEELSGLWRSGGTATSGIGLAKSHSENRSYDQLPGKLLRSEILDHAQTSFSSFFRCGMNRTPLLAFSMPENDRSIQRP